MSRYDLGIEGMESIKKENFARRKFGYNKKNGQEKGVALKQIDL